ncbi:MAG: 50S ribosomal protein L25 [Bdellovibrionales bacterium]|nr:50S ribosomal protein L25 [Bdellovibrionales bacterium]
MDYQNIEVQIRPGSGKGEARKLRAEKRVPGICYGPHMTTAIPLSVDRKELNKILRTGSTRTVYQLISESNQDVNGKTVLIKSRQIHPVSDLIEHVDFLAVDMNEEIKVRVPVVLVGKAKGVAEGGILQQTNRVIEVKCLPNAIPDKIVADVSGVDLNESLHVSDITLPKGVQIVGSVDYTLAAVVPPESEVAVKKEGEAADPDAETKPEATTGGDKK